MGGFFMNKDLESLLNSLEPEVDRKCFELKQKQRERKLQKLFIITSIMLLVLPSILIIANINIWSFIIGAIAVTSTVVIIMLPIALKQEVRGECYE